MSALIAIPILINTLGFELFAMVMLLITIAIFFHVYDFGIGRAMSFHFAKDNQANSAASGLFNTGILIATVFAAVVSIGFYFAAPYIAYRWLQLPDGLAPSVSSAFQIATVGILPSVISSTLRGVLEGRSAFNYANVGKILSGSLIFIAPLAALFAEQPNIQMISISIALSRVLVLLYFICAVKNFLNIQLIAFDFHKLKIIFTYSAWAAISGFFSTMFVYGDRFIVARYLSPESLSIYTVSQDILIRVLLVPWAMAMALMPIFAADSLGKKANLETYLFNKKEINKISFLLVLLTLILFYPAFYLWLGHDFIQKASPVILVQLIGILFCAMAQLPLVYAYAKGVPHLIAGVYLIEAVVYVLLGPWIFEKYGLMGATIVWSSRLVIEFFALGFLVRKLMR